MQTDLEARAATARLELLRIRQQKAQLELEILEQMKGKVPRFDL